jgi:hypothetical protein
MLLAVIQRSKELVRMVSALPASGIAHMTVAAYGQLFGVLGYIPTAVVTLLELLVAKSPGPTSSASQSEAQAIYEAADYPNLVKGLAKALETRTRGLSDAEKEADLVGSLCSRVMLLAHYYPSRITAIVDIGAIDNLPNQDISMITDAGRADAVELQPPWLTTESGLYDDAFQLGDEQWASNVNDFKLF